MDDPTTEITLPNGGTLTVEPAYSPRTGRLADLEIFYTSPAADARPQLVARGHSQSVNASLSGLITVYSEED
jgi:hypothetical protein